MELGNKLDKKDEARAKFKLQRESFAKQSLKDSILDDCNQKLGEALCGFIGKASLWIGYRKRGDEADPSYAIKASQVKKWAYPKIIGKDLKFYIPQSDQDWEAGPWGILEPKLTNSVEVDLHSSQGILVPGVAFDRMGGRLGSGQGFYDRVLHNYSGKKVGIGYHVQISDKPLPLDSHDVPMTDVVTEKEIISVRER